MKKPWYAYLHVQSPILKIAYGILSVVISIAVLLFVLIWSEEPRMAAQTANWEGRSIEKGADLFANNCANCHGPDGKGLPGVAPALNSRYLFTEKMEVDGELVNIGRLNDVGWAGSLQNYIKLTIGAGRPSKTGAHWAQIMPTWGKEYGGPLRGDQVEALSNYVMNWQDEAMAQTPEEDPWQFFRDTLSKGLPYNEDEPGYEAKVEAALEAARFAGVATYKLGDVEYELEPMAASGGEPQVLWESMGCKGCHDISQDQTDDNRGPVGPHQNNLYERAGERVEGLSAEEYVYQSIVEPGAYLVDGYANVMPPNFAERMSEDEIRGLVAWMLDPNRQLEASDAPAAEAESESTEETAAEEDTTDATESTAEETSAEETSDGEMASVTLDVITRDLYYGDASDNIVNPPVWTIPSNAEVTLNLDNQGGVEHSWGILKPGEEAPIPFLPDEHNDLLYFTTGLISAETQESFSFESPDPGEYIIICTAPGHYPVMQGRLVVEEGAEAAEAQEESTDSEGTDGEAASDSEEGGSDEEAPAEEGSEEGSEESSEATSEEGDSEEGDGETAETGNEEESSDESSESTEAADGEESEAEESAQE